MTRLFVPLLHRALCRQRQARWLPLHGNDPGAKTVVGRRGFRVEGAVGAVGAVEGAQEDAENEVSAIRREIWGVQNGGTCC